MPKPLALRGCIAGSVAITLWAAACSGKPSQPPAAEAPASEPAAPSATPAAEPPAAAAPANAPAAALPSAPPALRCGDLLSAHELAAAGVETTGYDPNKTADSPGTGVTCVLSNHTVTLFPGSAWLSMLDGWKANGPKNGVLAADGPQIGGAHQWTTMGPIHSLMFQSSNQRYAANLTGADKARVEKLARALAANMGER